MNISVRGLVKTFGNYGALRGVDLDVRPGELLALLGPSGSGKTTLLRVVAGLEFPDAGQGRVEFGGVDVTERRASERRAGFVFQQYALFQHMTVFENIAFGLRVRPRSKRPSKAEIAKRVRELLQLIRLEEFAKRYPAQLSGGQRQRVALARALAVEPQLLLLDEPFGALDAKVRRELCLWLRQFHDETHLTTLFVTHDQEEAFRLADRVAILGEGKVRQIGTPNEIRTRPEDDFVRHFLGLADEMHPESFI